MASTCGQWDFSGIEGRQEGWEVSGKGGSSFKEK